MKRTVLILFLLVLAAAAAFLIWRHTRPNGPATELTLYGNVDLRQVALAFNNSGRIEAVLVEEGNRVQPGQVLARLDASRIEPQLAMAEAQAEAQHRLVEKLHAGSRPEEIGQARANVDLAKAQLADTKARFDRLDALSKSPGATVVTQQDIDSAKALMDGAAARLDFNQNTLDLAVAGPRKEDIAAAEAQLQADLAQVDLLRQQLLDAKLTAPVGGVVRSRLLEPGEMVSPQRPVFTLAVIDPKWVRAFVAETDLGHVRESMAATVAVDTFPGRRFEGWVGFISPVAEFTPKTVQTEELRTSLVYEIRVFVKDPKDELRLGMPATVHLPLSIDKERGRQGEGETKDGRQKTEDGGQKTEDGKQKTEPGQKTEGRP